MKFPSVHEDSMNHRRPQVETGELLVGTLSRNGMLLELDASGNIRQSLQTTQLEGITEVLEHADGLYCGSYINKFILSVPRANLE